MLCDCHIVLKVVVDYVIILLYKSPSGKITGLRQHL